MSDKTRLSMIVLVRDEAEQLQALLPTLTPLGEEVIVIGDGKDERCKRVAKRYGAKYFRRALANNWAAQRNYGLEKAQGEWIFFIDVDERVSEELSAEIKKTIKKAAANDGYLVKREDYFLGTKLRFGETNHTWLVRLGRKGAGVWRRTVHEVWEIDNVGRLKGKLYHQSHQSTAELLATVQKYAALEARHRVEAGQEWSLGEMGLYPIAKWLRSIFWWRGWADGWRGLVMATAMSSHSFLVRWYQYAYEYGRHEAQGAGARWWRRWWWLFVVLVMAGQLGRWQLTQTVAIYGFEVVMGIQVMIVFGYGWAHRLKKGETPRYWWPMVGVFLVMAGSLIANGSTLGPLVWPSSLYMWRFGLYGLWWLSLWRVKERRWFCLPWWRVLIWLGAGWALSALGQYLFLPDTRWLFAYGWDEHYYRAVGVIFDPGFLGLLLILTIVMLEYRRGRWWRFLWGTAFISLLLTVSRASYLVYGVVVGLMAVNKRSLRMALGRWALLLVGLWWLPRPGGEGVQLLRTYSVETRVESTVTAGELFAQSPWWGHGYNAYRYLTQESHPLGLAVHPSGPDNSLMLILATMGVIGLIAVLWWFGGLVRMGRNRPEIWISLVAVLVHAFTNNSLFYVWVLIWVGMLVNEVEPREYR